MNDGGWLVGLFCDDEVDLSFFDVGCCDLYCDGVAELVCVVTAAAYQTVVFLVEVVVVVFQLAHGHHSFAVIVVDFAVYAVGLYSADVRLVGVSYLVGHEFHHFIFYAFPFGVGCYLFHVAGVLA